MLRKPNYSLLDVRRPNSKIIILLILGISAFIHLWNPIGFPEIFYDEGVYMHRTMNVINGVGPQDGKFYDHPFFGQIFLGSILYAIGYPDSLNPSSDSIESLYEIPRILMGILAVLDTFLIYKITQKQFQTKTAFAASFLFAVMPITWITRRVLLDSILLPFVLLSVLLAIYSKDSKHRSWLILFSGVSLGLAILTKVPAFTMIPVVVYLVYSQHKNKKLVVLLMVPILLLPMIWPAYSVIYDQFDYWKRDVLWQTQRQNTGIHNTALSFAAIDPVLFGLGVAGLFYAGIKRNWFLLSWTIPFVVFLSLIGYTQYFHWMILLPVFCIGASVLILDLGKNLNHKSKHLIPIFVMVVILSFGSINTILLLGLNVTSNQFEAASFASDVALQNDSVILAGPQFSWIYNDVLQQNNFQDYSLILFKPAPSNFILIVDPHFHLDSYRGDILSQLYNTTSTIKTFSSAKSNYNVYTYPYSSLGYNYDAGIIEVKTAKNLSD